MHLRTFTESDMGTDHRKAVGSRGFKGPFGMSVDSDWAANAACKTSDPDTLFVQGAAQNRAKAICSGCVVRTECLSDALDNRVEFGVWGGMTERERRALLRRRPNVASWSVLLQNASDDFARGTIAVSRVS